ncbi:hypothetical protein GCK32_000482 [Trichostrongylus colubriformis]|uniref:Uncharacterized protein n=1 Tax=Trichostrongylus colubriformis TaxID=6319 RepID=A0AAN8FM74_TRICO
MSEQPEEGNSANTYEIRNTNGTASTEAGVVQGKNDETVLAEEYANHLDMANDNEDNVMLHEFQNYPVEEMAATNRENSVGFDTTTSKLLRNSDDEPTDQRGNITKSDAAMVSNVIGDPGLSSNKGTTEGVEIPAL